MSINKCLVPCDFAEPVLYYDGLVLYIAEVYLEPSQISMIEPFCINS